MKEKVGKVELICPLWLPGILPGKITADVPKVQILT